jgi:Cys-rich four helix bundle protein (predicted Tat secretion target)
MVFSMKLLGIRHLLLFGGLLMNRRDVIKSSLGGIGMAALVGAGSLFESTAFAAATSNDKLGETSSKCIAVGLKCLAHCQQSLAQGSKVMAECAASVSDMIAAVSALQRLAASNSPHVKAMAKVCGDICKSCATKCEPHSKTMDICKACLDACKECADACAHA